MIRTGTKPRPGRLKGAALDELRMKCFERDGRRCTNCGAWVNVMLHHTQDRSYHMAHIKAKRMGGDRLENVRTLCGKCHRLEHA